MAAVANIGGVGAGLQQLMKAGSPSRQADVPSGSAQQSFAEQLGAMQGGRTVISGTAEETGAAARKAMSQGGSSPLKQDYLNFDLVNGPSKPASLEHPMKGGSKPAGLPPGLSKPGSSDQPAIEAMKPVVIVPFSRAVRPAGGEAGPGHGVVNEVLASGGQASKSIPPKKLPVAGGVHGKTDAEPSKDVVSLAPGMAGFPGIGVTPVSSPLAKPEVAVAPHASKVGTGMVSAEKTSSSRGREALGAPGLAGHVVASADGDGKGSGAGLPQASGAQPAEPAAAIASSVVGRVGGVASAAVAPALAVPDVASARETGINKGSGTGHQASLAAERGFHGEMEGASGAVLSEPRTLVSTANVLEVGITGGAHGWLRVRAELEHTGEVTASLVASSAASADALHKELGAMSAYLKSEVVGVSSLAVTAMEKSGTAQGFMSQGRAGGSGSGDAGGAGGQTSRQRQDAETKQFSLAQFGSEYGGQAAPAALLGTGVGGWLNVRV